MTTLAIWISAWVIISILISKKSKSIITIVGGGLIGSCVFLIIVFFIKNNYMPEKKDPPPAPPKQVAAKSQPTAAEKAALAAKREKERAERERKKADEYERCKIDLQCWGEKHLISAASASQGMIERQAKFDFEWIDGFWKTKLSKWRWLDENKYTLIYFGDQIKLQNGFGAWQRCIYRVDYDPINKRVLDVTVTPGRL